MGDSIYDLLDSLEHRGPSRRPSQYLILQSQFRQPPRPAPARDRYRAPRQHARPAYDGVQDDELYEQGVPFDLFDEKLSQQPFENRQMLAVPGRARLSFAPKAPGQYNNGAQQSFQAQDHSYSQQRVPGLSQFAYGTTQPPKSSSNPQLESSSSPAYKASQRRAEHHQQTDEGDSLDLLPDQQRKTSVFRPQASQRAPPKQSHLPHSHPVIQGILLVSITQLPDRLRAVFPFPYFNAVQSKCFEKVYKSDNNFVLASPTGSGKTAILELAICRAISNNAIGQYKIIYQAPTKALCSERQRDWQKKFSPLGLTCIELTGDSDYADLKNVQTANVIITTPEKWDFITRKWKDHEKLITLIKLFLIDEVHILKEERGATLETIVSRMKTIGTDVRFVALSATVPNFDDVATWLGKNAAEPNEPASKEKFGEEFRPIKLRKHVCGYNNNCNDWMFDKVLDSKLPEVISTYSERKPIMVFCCTRNSCKATAKLLAEWWTSKSSRDRHWNPPRQLLQFQDRELRECATCGVAFHHAGLELNDRLGVENGFLKGEINVICCTSTLAVGINLPCHFVIIKNTVTFGNGGLQECSDLEIMQMLGRAGRPQFDDSATAVIMTRQAKVRRYEMMVTGEDLLESTLHLGLIEHLNAEIGLGTIRDLPSARKWIAGTFLYVRLKQNPAYYKLEGARSGQDLDEQLDDICLRDIALLQDNDLVTGEQHLRCTDFGDAMTRYYIRFETMRIFVNLREKVQISEILSAIAQAAEFERIRFRAGEKTFYKNINKSSSIRFQIPVNLTSPAHKVSLMIQSVLGAANLSLDDDMQRHKAQYNMEMTTVFKHASRLVSCIIDCQISLGDSVSINHALMMDRSLGARAWDESPLQLKQIEDVGMASIMKFINAGIRSIADLEYTEAHKIEAIMKRNPPFGLTILNRLKLFPKLRVSLHVLPRANIRTSEGVKVQVKVDIGFMNEKPCHKFNGKPVYVCVLAEISNGRMIHFARISGQKLDKGQQLIFSALLTSTDQFINCYVTCEKIAGTQREATVKPMIAPSMFPAHKPPEVVVLPHQSQSQRPKSNISIGRMKNINQNQTLADGTDEFDDVDIDDDALVQATLGGLDFDDIEDYSNPTDTITRRNTTGNAKKAKRSAKPVVKTTEFDDHEPTQLLNGKWACNHKCKDKNICKHMCCRDGLEKPPKRYMMKKSGPTNEAHSQSVTQITSEKRQKTQTKLQLPISKRKASVAIEELDMTQQGKKKKSEYAMSEPADYRNLQQLHKNTQKKEPAAFISSIKHKKPAYHYGAGGGHSLSFMEKAVENPRPTSSDYGDFELDGLSFPFDLPVSSRAQKKSNSGEYSMDLNDDPVREVSSRQSDVFDDDGSMFGDVMVGLADSQALQAANRNNDHEARAFEEFFSMDNDMDFEDHETPAQGRIKGSDMEPPFLPNQFSDSSTVAVPEILPGKGRSLFYNDTSSSLPEPKGFKITNSRPKGPVLSELKQAEEVLPTPRATFTQNDDKNEQDNEFDVDENDLLDLSEAHKLDETKAQGIPVPDGFKDLEPWLFAEFGDIVELIDD